MRQALDTSLAPCYQPSLQIPQHVVENRLPNTAVKKSQGKIKQAYRFDQEVHLTNISRCWPNEDFTLNSNLVGSCNAIQYLPTNIISHFRVWFVLLIIFGVFVFGVAACWVLCWCLNCKCKRCGNSKEFRKWCRCWCTAIGCPDCVEECGNCCKTNRTDPQVSNQESSAQYKSSEDEPTSASMVSIHSKASVVREAVKTF